MNRHARSTEPDYSASCNRCTFHSADAVRAVISAGREHEAGNDGHQVTVWDTDTSQLPRSTWAQG
jgi:hypothetical protein